MIAVPTFSGSRVAVFGLGRSGISAARALVAGQADVIAWDDSEERRAEAAAEGIPIGDLYEDDWAGISDCVLSPGVPLTHPKPHAIVEKAQSVSARLIGDIELFGLAQAASPKSAPIVAVTGTNGKSTTCALIGHLLRFAGWDAQVGGNIGTPALDLDPPSDNTVYILELSSFQIDLIRQFHPHVAVLLNISPDHLDRHGTIERYAEIKSRLFAKQEPGDAAIVGVDDPYSMQICTGLCSGAGPKPVPVSVGKALGHGVYVIDGVLYDGTNSTVSEVLDLKTCPGLPGAHNWQNAAAAFTAVRGLKLENEDIIRGLQSFPGLAHRLEGVAEVGGVRFFNDSKATNAEAAVRALACFDNIYWIVGGRAKDGGLEGLESYFPRVAKAYLVGEAAPAFRKALKGKVDCVVCGTIEKAVALAADDARASQRPDPVVLLSPACASFDQFPDFEKRGDAFKHAVSALDPSSVKREAAR